MAKIKIEIDCESHAQLLELIDDIRETIVCFEELLTETGMTYGSTNPNYTIQSEALRRGVETKTGSESKSVSYSVFIRNNQTGEVRKHIMDLPWDENSYYWWTEGNFGCDCNRDNEFRRAGNEPILDEPPCGDKRYSVLKVVLETGEEIKIDSDQKEITDLEETLT